MRKPLLCVLGIVALVLNGRAADVPVAAPQGVINPNNGHRYILLKPDTWTHSEAAAVALGGHLVTVNDAAEQAWLVQAFGPEKDNSERSFWIGLHQEKGAMAWSSGEKSDYRCWGPGEPNDAGKPAGACVYIGRYPGGGWNDTNDTFTVMAAVGQEDGALPHGLVELDPVYEAPANADEVPALLRKLSDPEFDVREAASRRLERLGPAAFVAVRTALRHATDAELQSRLADLDRSLAWTAFLKSGESLAQYARRMGIKETRHAVTLSEGGPRMTFTLVPAGIFAMGSPNDEVGRNDDEFLHSVRIADWHRMSTTPVTQAQWKALMKGNPSAFTGDDRPVERVTYDDALNFCAALTRLEEERGGHSVYRLPTEAEWEFACRAGTTTAFNRGPTLEPMYANFNATTSPNQVPGMTFRGESVAVGSFGFNTWGLADMHGNVREWCIDFYAADPWSFGLERPESPLDWKGPEAGMFRVQRGGGWCDIPRLCRSAARSFAKPDEARSFVGFRVVEELGE